MASYDTAVSTPVSAEAPVAWVPDTEATQCYSCSEPFSMLKRKHHCRNCGKIFCGPCSSEKMMIDPRYGKRHPVRTCMNCTADLQPYQSEYAEVNANCHRTNHLADDPVRRNLPAVVRPHANNPFTMTLGSAIRNATYTLMQQVDPLLIPDQKIPEAILSRAEGFLFLTFLRVGFLGGARLGTGLAIVKREDGSWGAPSAVGMGGFSVGFMVGADCVNLCLVLTSRRVCSVLASRGQVSFEGELGASVGPIGRNASVGVNIGNDAVAPVYSYSQSRGIFAGVDLSGSLIVARRGVNHRFYGMPYHTNDILMGDIPRPDAGHALYEAIGQVTAPIEMPSRMD